MNRLKCELKWQASKSRMTYQEISDKSGVSLSTVKHAALDRNIGLSNAGKIAGALNLTIADLWPNIHDNQNS